MYKYSPCTQAFGGGVPDTHCLCMLQFTINQLHMLSHTCWVVELSSNCILKMASRNCGRVFRLCREIVAGNKVISLFCTTGMQQHLAERIEALLGAVGG